MTPAELGLSDAEFALLYHVNDTIVRRRDEIVGWAAGHPPNQVRQDPSAEELHRALDALLARGLLVELDEAEIEADLARWRDEPRPVSWGVSLDREPLEIDVTEAGFRLLEPIFSRGRRHVGYDRRTPGLVRVLADSEAACREHLAWLQAEQGFAGTPGELQRCGPWWYDRYVLVPDGYEIRLNR